MRAEMMRYEPAEPRSHGLTHEYIILVTDCKKGYCWVTSMFRLDQKMQTCTIALSQGSITVRHISNSITIRVLNFSNPTGPHVWIVKIMTYSAIRPLRKHITFALSIPMTTRGQKWQMLGATQKVEQPAVWRTHCPNQNGRSPLQDTCN